MNTFIPPEIAEAVTTLLEPYGINVKRIIQQEPPPIQWETLDASAKRLGVTMMTIRRIIDTGKVEIGRCSDTKSAHYLINAKSLDDFLRGNAESQSNLQGKELNGKRDE